MMKTKLLVIIGIVSALTITFFVLGPSQGHIAQYFLTDEQFEDIILNNDNTDRYSTYDESNCDEICIDDNSHEEQKTYSEDERKFFCESHEGKWSDEFHNCVGGSMTVSCDYVSTSELKPPNVFSKIINQDGTCTSHEFFCKSMGGTSACMSYEQKGHGRDICISVCEFE